MIKLVLREIKNSLGRYIAIMAIIALGIGFFTGLVVTRTSMLHTLDDYVTENSLYNWRLRSTMGYTEENAAAVAESDIVRTARGAVEADVLVSSETGSDFVMRAHSLTEGINIPDLKAGRLPESPDECLADSLSFSEGDIGSVIRLSEENSGDTLDMFAFDEYTVVGVAASPLYINYERGSSSLGNGGVYAFFLIPEEGFDTDYYTDIYVSLTDSAEPFTDAYDELSDSTEGPVTELAEAQAQARRDRIVADAQSELDEARAEFDDAVKEYSDGLSEYEEERERVENELADAQTKLDDARAEYENGLSSYYSAASALDSSVAEGERQIADKQAELDAALETLNAGEAEYEASKAALDEAEAQYAAALEQYESSLTDPPTAEELALMTPEQLAQLGELAAQAEAAKAELDAVRAQLDGTAEQLAAARAQLDAGWAEHDAGSAALDEARAELKTQTAAARDRLYYAWTQLESAAEEIEDGQAELDDARAEADEKFAEAEAELEDAKKKIDDAQVELTDAQREIDDIPEVTVYVLGRDANVGYSCFESDSEIVTGIARVFPFFFFLVAALVCITTMTRMVDEQRTQIGVFKAMGYSSASIMGKYLLYSGSAAVLGCAAGFFAGSFGIPAAVWQAYNIMYQFDELHYYLDFPLGAAATAAYLIVSSAATWLACHRELRDVPAQLLLPRAPKAGKRILLERVTFLWKRVPFLHKVSIRNIVRYRQRFFMMVIGIGGCTALLITGYGIRDSISNVVAMQFDEITTYQYAVTFDSGLTADDMDGFAAYCGEDVPVMSLVYEGTMDAWAGGVTKTARVAAPAEGDLEGLVDLHSGDESLPYPGTGQALVCTKLADSLGLKPGDTLTLRDGDMNTLELTVTGVFENFIYNYVFTSADSFTDQWGRVPEMKTVWAGSAGGTDVHAAAARMLDYDGVLAVAVSDDMAERVGNMMGSLNYIVWLVIICSGALAFIVLYNLTNINITERLREIATIKVLGFYPHESALYVFRENFVLTAIGAVAGLPLGKALHAYVMGQIKVDMVYFDARVMPVSYLYAILFTFLFAVAVDLFMYFKLERINMAEALKANE